jgi:hypothetical protein
MDNTAGRSLDLDCSAVTTNSVDIRVLRGTNSTGTKRFTIYAGDGSATSRHTLYGAQVGGVSALLGVGGGTVGIGAVGTANFTLQVDGTIGPNTDNVRNLGSASFRMATIFAGTGAINTSDATLKSLRDGTLIGLNFKVSPLEAVEVAAARDLLKEIGVYKFLDAVAEKGEGARLHIGLTVQRGIQIMEAHGLDPWAYGIFCRDAITRRVPVTRTRVVEKIDLVDEPESTVEIRDGVPTLIAITRTREVPVIERRALVDEGGQAVIGEDGEQVFCDVPVMVEEEFVEEVEEAAGERLGFRYDQLNMFLIAALAEAVTGGH